MPEFVEKFAAKPELLSRADKTAGSPHTLIVAGAGLRSADIVRAMRKFQGKNCAVAKLFAKHMKVAEQVSFLTKQRVGMGVGTPARLSELIENGMYFGRVAALCKTGNVTEGWGNVTNNTRR